MTSYDADQNISAGYNLASSILQVVTTIYIYPAPRVLSIMSPPEVTERAHAMLRQREFQQIKQVISNAHPEAKLLAEDEFSFTQGAVTRKAPRVTYAYQENFAGQTQQVVSQAYLFNTDKWLVKYRVTYPANLEADVTNEINALIRTIPWSKGEGI